MIFEFETLRLLHVCCAFASILGFAVRGYWQLTGHPLIEHRLVRVVPHLVDTTLLASAITMLVLLNLSPLQLPWLLLKIIALLAYIVLGMVALRFGRSTRQRMAAYALALLCASFIVSVAYSKNPAGFFTYLI